MVEERESRGTLVVPADSADGLVRMLKQHLTGDRTCEECGYAAPVSRWGYRAHEVGEGRVALTACCPSCEALVPLRRNRSNHENL